MSHVCAISWQRFNLFFLVLNHQRYLGNFPYERFTEEPVRLLTNQFQKDLEAIAAGTSGTSAKQHYYLNDLIWIASSLHYTSSSVEARVVGTLTQTNY